MLRGLKIGLEKEYFVIDNDGEPTLCPDELPSDACGLLAEARGKPCDNITEAVYSLMAEEYRMIAIADFLGVTLIEQPVMKISKKLRDEASRVFAKGVVRSQNLYGHLKHRHKVSEMTAGVHISFTRPDQIYYEGITVTTVNRVWDYVQLFKKFDDRFKDVIKASKRRPGFYEIKDDGRIEYRSLPSDVNLFYVIENVKEAINE